MEAGFILSCESTVDIPYSYVSGRNIPVLFYSYYIDEAEYEDDMDRTESGIEAFYGFLNDGKLPRTSQINQFSYLDFFEEQIVKGDVLHIAFSSGLTGSVQNARLAAEEVMEKHPGRKITVIDSLCASSGYGMLVDYVADMRDSGASLEETAKWAEDNKSTIIHDFFSTDLSFFKRSGRMSGPAAKLGTILNICPMLHIDSEGKIIAYGKERGKSKAIQATVNSMLNHADNGADYGGKCFICHSNCIDDAARLASELEKAFTKLEGKIRVFNIGPIIASHTGPGTVSLFFKGDTREI